MGMENYVYIGLILLGVILTMLSVCDIRERLIPNRYVAAVFIIAVPMLNFEAEVGSRIAGCFIIALPVLIVMFINERSFGGGDMKLFFAAGFLLGMGGALLCAVIAFALGGAAGCVAKLRGRQSIAFGPYISIGIMLAYINEYLIAI
jgi:leader peptidase (prepilin peptidase)/N-methyltransferase